MKKKTKKASLAACIVCVLLVVFFLRITGPPLQFNAGSKAVPNESVFPASLQVIAMEAFEGTAIESAVFGDELRIIEDRAFYGTYSLHSAYLPPSVEKIGEQVFFPLVTVHGVAGSFAEQWADEHGLTFVSDDVWTCAASAEQGESIELPVFLFVLFPFDEKIWLWISERIKKFFKSMRQKDRPELYPIEYRFP